MVRRAKRTLYNENVNEKSATMSGRESGADAGIIKVDEQKEEREKSDTEAASVVVKRRVRRKVKRARKTKVKLLLPPQKFM